MLLNKYMVCKNMLYYGVRTHLKLNKYKKNTFIKLSGYLKYTLSYKTSLRVYFSIN